MTWREAQPLFSSLAHEQDPQIRHHLREQLIEGHRRLALSVIARGMAAGYLSGATGGDVTEDLEQIALMGLIQAVDRFELAAGVRFSTFAVITIRGGVMRHQRDRNHLVRLPRRYQQIAAAARHATEVLTSELKSSPTPAQIAAQIGGNITEEDVENALAASAAVSTYSLDAPNMATSSSASDSRGGTLLDSLGSEDAQLVALLSHTDLYAAVQVLSGQERRVLLLRFWEELSQCVVGKRMGLSQMQVSRLERRALGKLRVLLNSSA